MANTVFGPPLTDEQRQRWQERLMARQPRPVPHQRFGYNQWREIVDSNPNYTDIMLTQQQWDELRHHLNERLDIAPPRDVDAGLQFEGRNIHIMPEDPPELPERRVIDDLQEIQQERTITRDDIQELRDRLTEGPADTGETLIREAGEWAPARPEEDVPVEPPHAGLDINDPFSPQGLENALNFHVNRYDYDNLLGVSAELTLRNAIRTPVRNMTPAQIEEQTFEMKRMLISRFTSALGRRPEYRNIDDSLRDFIFWMHKNVRDDKRSEADILFEEMRNQIWPDAT